MEVFDFAGNKIREAGAAITIFAAGVDRDIMSFGELKKSRIFASPGYYLACKRKSNGDE